MDTRTGTTDPAAIADLSERFPGEFPDELASLPSGPTGLGTSAARLFRCEPVPADVPEPPPAPEPEQAPDLPDAAATACPVTDPDCAPEPPADAECLTEPATAPEAECLAEPAVHTEADLEPAPELEPAADLEPSAAPECAPEVQAVSEPEAKPAAKVQERKGQGRDGEDEQPKVIKGLKFRRPLRDDRALADRVNERLMIWAEKEVELYPGDQLRAMFLAFDPGRSVVMCHPDAASFDHLVAAGMLYIGENAVDDYFCEPDLGGHPEGLGARLLVAQSAIDPLHTTKPQIPKWLAGLASHPALRAMRSAMGYFERIATPAQAHRYRHDICNLYLGYCAEAACIQTGRTPAVWEYLAQRQFNNFRPCLTITDAVGGYELPASMFARPDVQRATALSSNATTIVNDLYSLRKEMAQERVHHSLPTVIAHEEGVGIEEAFQKTIEIHNELMDDFEALSALLAPTDPVLARYLAGLSNWAAGNHEWHSGLVGTRYATAP
ncbi:terpene synthase family protein [Actinomadura rupiterrae]|uniref:terpene synthase family protein n=1 Tax=Actinomadura rupiterrae TaxID=559627 RepID=UPI0020A60CE7|nr:2-methylisoborneol synthase [Actinomadura rupiterrae]MCP2341645.1 2-methylisoborneol synthase [Actinomadura rupiterrae]